MEVAAQENEEKEAQESQEIVLYLYITPISTYDLHTYLINILQIQKLYKQPLFPSIY